MNNIIATTNHILKDCSVHEFIRIIHDIGYTGAEIWYDHYVQQIKDGITSLELVKKAIEDTGMTAVVHGPIEDRIAEKMYKYNISSKDKELREKSIKETIDSLKFCKELGLDIVNIHPGALDDGQEPDEEYWDLLVEAMKMIADEAEKQDVVLAVETMENRPREFIKTTEDIHKLMELADNRLVGVGITFDITHIYTNIHEATMELIRNFKDIIYHVHVSGFGGKHKTHAPFKLTEKPPSLDYISELIKAIAKRFDGVITVEGTIKGILPETEENEIQAVKDNLKFIKPLVI